MAELKDEVNYTSNLSEVNPYKYDDLEGVFWDQFIDWGFLLPHNVYRYIYASNMSGVNDFQERERDRQYFHFIFYGILVPLIACFGFVGNSLTMCVLFRREMCTVYYLRALVITDSGILLGAVAALTPFSISEYFTDFRYYKDVVRPLTDTYLMYAVMVSRTCNVWVTVFVSVERYIAICHPSVARRITTKRTTLLVIASETTFSIIYNIPRIFATTHRACSDNSPDCYEVVYTDFGITYGYQIVFYLWMYVIVLYGIPLTALFVLNILIIRELMRMVHRRRTTQRTNIQNDDEANVSLVLVLIVVVFIICQTPGSIDMFNMFSLLEQYKFLAVSNTLIVLNSSVNFLIYAFVGRRFRKVLMESVFYKCMPTESPNTYELTHVQHNVLRQ